MSTPLERKKINNLGVYGVIRQTEVDDNLLPDEAVTHALNVHFDRKGAVTLRNGLTAIGSQIVASKPCLGLYNALFEDSTKNCLLSVFSDGINNDIYKLSGANWIKSLEDDTKNLKTRFTSFANRVIRVNGTDDMKCFNGTSWETSGNPINPDQMKGYSTKFIELFKSKVYTIGITANPDRLFYSSVINSSGNISWNPSIDFVDINPSDGENTTALKRYSLHLLIFKPNYLYRYYGIQGMDPDPLVNIGTYSQESVIEAKDGVYYHHPYGIYKYSGGYPVNISKPVSDFINAIPVTYYNNVSSWVDDDHVYFSIGDVTIEGVSFVNIVLRRTISSEIWTVYSYSPELVWGSSFNDGTTLYRIVGDNNGYVYKFDQGNTDNGAPISYELVTKWHYLESIAETKIINKMIGLCERAQASILEYQVDENPVWYKVGTLKKYITFFKNLSIKFHRIRFRLIGTSTVAPFIFQGIEILSGTNQGIID